MSGARALGLVALAATLPYTFALACDFTYDDHWTIVGNGFLRRPFGEMTRALFSGAAAERGVPDASRPLMVLSNAFDVRCFGLRPMAHHLHSLVLHALEEVARRRCINGAPRRARPRPLGSTLGL